MAEKHVVAKAQAETPKAKAEAAAAVANAGNLRALTRKAVAEAEWAEFAVVTARIESERQKEKRSRELAGNEYHHVYHFTESVGASSTRACMTQLATWSRTEAGCDMEIMFSSPGGSVIDGMALFDYIQQIRAAGHQITTSTIGYAASMAGILLQAGDVRVMGREAYILVHEVSFGAGGKLGEVEDEVAFVKKIQSRVLDIFAARTKMTKRQLEARWRRKDWWLDSSEAFKLGFVDEVR